jgi:hypothetical protein
VVREEGLDGLRRPVEHDPDVVVPGGPGVRDVGLEAGLEDLAGPGAEPGHGLPQRGPPLLVPAGVGPGAAAAVAPPALDAVGAAPGRHLADPDLVDRREALQVVPVDRDLGQAALLDVAQGVGQGHLAEAVMVPVGLAVGGDVDDLGPASLPHAAGEGAGEAIGELLAVAEERAEGDVVRDRAVVEE